jgi:hypothetical protein
VKLLLKISERLHWVLMAITLSLFIGFEHMSNEQKVEEVNYEFGIGSFLRVYLDQAQKCKFFRLLKSDQPRISAAWSTFIHHNS